jgi:tyrosine-protein kinase Etk/Wzc
MNARNLLQPPTQSPAPTAPLDKDQVNLVEYWDIVVDNRWAVAAVTALVVAVGATYAFLARPIYEANLLIQVEDSAASAKSFLGEASTLFDVKTPAAAEIEIIRSRMVIGRAVDGTLAYIDATPRYLPIVGNWLARHATELSNPGFLGLGGYVTGTEHISVSKFDVPRNLEGTGFRLTAGDAGRYTLSHPEIPQEISGTVGTPLVARTSDGVLSLVVDKLDGKRGAQFNLVRRARLAAMEDLQANLKVAEKGHQSGVIEATMQSPDPAKLTLVLNEIGRQYVQQNVERKAAEAKKMLAFLDAQMPQFKKQLNDSEQAYSKYRNATGTISIEEEAKAVLKEQGELEGKLLDAEQKRRELIARFTPDHPAVKTLDGQVAALKKELASLYARVRAMPTVQQDAVRLERDVKVNDDAYQNLRNNALQLQLIREGKVGNVRLIDAAALPEAPVRPKPLLVVLLSAILGVAAGVSLALVRNAFFRGVRDPQEIEVETGLNVYSTIPLSATQDALVQLATSRKPGLHVLAAQAPQDPAVESLRSLRTALQFAMLEAPNNRVLVTGATPSVGKSFVSANLACVLAIGGKRVLLIDADMRKGHLNQYFGISRERGLSEVIAGTISATQAIRKALLPNLDVLPTGVLPPNPAELMMSTAFASALQELSLLYDYVIMDTPPVLVAADTIGIAAQAGTVLLVARSGQTQIGELNESSKRLAQAGKTVSGVLFNAVDLSRRHYGSYGYKYGRYKYRHYSYESQSN